MNIEVYPTKPAKVGVYPSYGGGRSTQVADVAIDVVQDGLTVNYLGVIWARLARDKDTGEESITFEAGLPKGVKIDDETQRDEFKSIVLASAEVWFGYAAAEAKAVERLYAAPGAKSAARKVIRGSEIEDLRTKA